MEAQGRHHIKNLTAVIATGRNDRIGLLERILVESGFRVVVAGSMALAVKFIKDLQPHLVLCDGLKTGGTSFQLFDAFQHEEPFKRIQFVITVPNKNAEELAPLRGRKFAAVFIGKTAETLCTTGTIFGLNRYWE